MNSRLLNLLIPVFFLGACTVTGPPDDGFENSNEWVDNGRLFSDDSSGYTIYSSEKKKSADSEAKTGDESLSDDQLDFAAYKKWLEAKENNSPEYQKFKQWQDFENYQRWKERQKAE